jgi:hypothetical protein
MRWKTTIAVVILTLVVTGYTAPSRVEAQSIVMMALVVGIGADQALEIHYSWQVDILPQAIDHSTVPGDTVPFTIVVMSGDGLCSQTLETRVMVHAGINHLKSRSITEADGSVWLEVNGDKLQMNDCFRERNRIVLAFGVRAPEQVVEGFASEDPHTIPPAFERLNIIGYDVVGPDASTEASASGAGFHPYMTPISLR